MRFTLLSTLAFLAISVSGAPIAESVEELVGRGNVDYYDPREKGGSLLDQSAGLGEPLNVIISGKSSPEVLTKDGFNKYALAAGYSIECFGQHQGGAQKSNLGDGRGYTDEIEVIRENFGDPLLGTCLESLAGGNHLRLWQQNGPDANSGALFLAVSQEEDLSQHHTIAADGYNVGRDRFAAAVKGTHIGFNLKKYTTTVQDITGLMPAGTNGINHGIAVDGVVKLLTVTVKNIF